MRLCRTVAVAAICSAPLTAAFTTPPGVSNAALRGEALKGRSSMQMQQAMPEQSFSDNVAEPTGEASWLERWGRTMAVTLSFVVALTAGVAAPRAAFAEGESSPVNLYFGQGCFWHVQHDFVVREGKNMGRKTAGDITAVAGYAGGKEVGQGDRVCYHNGAGAPDYGKMGHTEVVNVKIPEDQIYSFAKEFFDDANGFLFGRRDFQDLGTEYRSAIGLPGGMDGPLFQKVKEANNNRLTLLKGEGNDADTVGSKKVWVYDSEKFPFYQGEIYHQFHNDMTEFYDDAYRAFKGQQLETGGLKKVGCPDRI
eukprot:TRINITY_DN8369_c0_g1_i1.p1 TRINITY_DN8369_c0_g1~~TRINITY_DN8369_c0_g1_i1.p1  ORF type:complete len:309 (+),score=76.20 TRINITY_DN8369_c0_g1_i1:73-999(+)